MPPTTPSPGVPGRPHPQLRVAGETQTWAAANGLPVPTVTVLNGMMLRDACACAP